MIAEIFFIVFGLAYILVVARSLIPRPTPTRKQMIREANKRDCGPASSKDAKEFIESRQ